MSKRYIACVALLCAAASAIAHADTPGAACLNLQDDTERLACFDRTIGDAVHGTVESAVPVATDRATASAAQASEPAVPEISLLDTTWGFLPDSSPAYIALYQPNYVLFGRYTSNLNTAPYQPLFDAFDEEGDFKDVEAKFQLSVKARLMTSDDRRWGLWFAYTQQSWWQVYSPDDSRPFRETNYMPEVFGSFRPGLKVGDMQWNLLNFGYVHESNGRADPISRSWDRVFVQAGLEQGDFALLGKVWARVKPSGYEDENPNIEDYYGYGELTAYYKWRENSFSLMGRGNPSTGKGAAQFTWATRPLLGPLRGYLQIFTGYGESMIDYNWRQTTIGIGVTLNDRL